MNISIGINQSRLFVTCPDCGTKINPDGMAKRNELVCPKCYPDAYRDGYAPAQRPDGTVIWEKVPDYFIRNQTVEQARMDGKAYPIEYPPDLDRIVAVLRLRSVENQNMNPGETPEDLVKENADHGIEAD